MKKLTLLLVILQIVNLSTAQENEISYERQKPKRINHQPLNSIYLSPLNAFFQNIELGYERQFGARDAFLIKSNFGYNKRETYYNSPNSDETLLQVYASLAYKRYIIYTVIKPNKKPERKLKNLFGLYISPYGAYQYVHSSYYEYTSSVDSAIFRSKNINSIQGGLEIGTRFDLAKGLITLDFHTGAGFKYSFNDLSNYVRYTNIYQIGQIGIIAKGNISIGFNF